LRVVLYLLIPAAWLAVLVVGMTMLRLAARSDRAYTEAIALWIAVYGPVQGEGAAHPLARGHGGENEIDPGYRATG
jgi:hypothetical protein